MRYLVLVVEDNPTNMALITAFLAEEEDMEVITATNGAEGVHATFSRVPDIVLMDVSLPLLSGLDATRILKDNSKTRDIPVIAVTAHAMTGDKQKCIDAGCDDYETKPVDAKRLIKKMRTLLDARPHGAVEHLHHQRREQEAGGPSAQALQQTIRKLEGTVADLQLRAQQSTAEARVLSDSLERERVGFQQGLEALDDQYRERLAATDAAREKAEAAARSAEARAVELEAALGHERDWAAQLARDLESRTGGARTELDHEAEARIEALTVDLAAARAERDAQLAKAEEARKSADAALAKAREEAMAGAARLEEQLERAKAAQKSARNRRVQELEREVAGLTDERTRLLAQLADARSRQESTPADTRLLQHELQTARDRLQRTQRTLATIHTQLRQVVDNSYQSLLFGGEVDDGVPVMVPPGMPDRYVPKAR